MNGTDLIKADHRRVAELFERFETEDDPALLGVIFDALTAHDDAEHGALYPLATSFVDQSVIDDAVLAHARVKMLVDMARAMEGGALRVVAGELRASVERHATTEEESILPVLELNATPAQLDELAARIKQIKQRVG